VPLFFCFSSSSQTKPNQTNNLFAAALSSSSFLKEVKLVSALVLVLAFIEKKCESTFSS